MKIRKIRLFHIERLNQMICLIFLCFIVTRLWAQTADQANPGFEDHKSSSIPAGFIYAYKLIYLMVRVNQKEDFLFLLDTGANVSVIDLQAARRLKLSLTGKSTVEGSGGIVESDKTKVRSFSVGQAKVKNLDVTTQDLSGFPAPAGKTINGILGYDFLRLFSVKIDYQNRQIMFSKKTAPKSSDTIAATTAVPFKLDNGIPRFPAVLEQDIPADFRLDTGASLFETNDVYLNITEEVWNALKARNPQLKPEKYFSGNGTGGEVKLAVSRLKEFALSDVRVSRPFVIVQPKMGYFARSDAVGFVSNNLLEKYSPVTIDYPEQVIYLSRK